MAALNGTASQVKWKPSNEAADTYVYGYVNAHECGYVSDAYWRINASVYGFINAQIYGHINAHLYRFINARIHGKEYLTFFCDSIVLKAIKCSAYSNISTIIGCASWRLGRSKIIHC